MYVYKDRWFDGFDAGGDTARLLTSVAAFRPDYTLSTMYMNSDGMSAYMLNLDAILEGLHSLEASTRELGLDAMALLGIGNNLYSDMRASDFMNRDQMRGAIQSALEELETPAWLQAGNAYALPCAAMVYDLTLYASAHPLLTQEIPLVQMVLSGNVDYAATSMQYAMDERDYLLRCIAFGSGLYVQAYAENGAQVKYTDFDDLYAGSWPQVAERVQSAYASAADALSQVAGQVMVHYSVQGNISRSLYANGMAVYVNYGGEPGAFIAPEGTRVEVPAYGWTHRKEAVE